MYFFRAAVLSLAALAICAAPLSAAAVPQKKSETIRQTVPRTPEEEKAHRHYVDGAGYFLSRRFEEAIAAFGRSLQIQPENAEARFALGNTYFENGQTLEALREWRSALKYNPDLVDAYLRIGAVYRTQGDAELAMEQYQKALKRRPDDFAAQLAVGTMHHEAGNLKKAEAALQRAVELDPHSAEAQDKLGLLYHDRKYRKASVARFKDAIKLAPDRAEFYDHLGHAYAARAGDSEGNALKTSIKLRKATDDKKLKESVKISKQNERLYLEKAISNWRKSLQIDETNQTVRTSLAGALQRIGKIDEAADEYRRVAIALPSDARAQLRLGDALLEKKEPIDALYFYEAALALDPDLYDAHFQKGLAYSAKKLVPEATAAFKAYMDAAPDSEKEKKTKAQQLIRIINFVPEER